MKKLFLLLAAGALVAPVANAQQSQSIMLNSNHGIQVPAFQPRTVNMPNRMQSHNNTANKTTSTNPDAWFSFVDALYSSGFSSVGLLPIYNDSSLYVPNGTPDPFYWYIAGLGTSMDPTSMAFDPSMYLGVSVYPQPSYTVTNSDAYNVDSVTISGFYNRLPNNNYTDTLNIYVAASGTTGALNLGYAADAYWYTNLNIPDSSMHFATMGYDSSTNSIPSSVVPGVIKITKILDAAAFADSTSSGTHTWTFAIPGGLSVPAGGKVVAYEQYISGHTYPFGTSIDSANMWWVLCAELNGSGTYPSQMNNDYNTGLITTTDSRYNIDTQATIYQGQQYISSTYAYGASAAFDNPYLAFHIHCTTCNNLAVANVNNLIKNVTAYPNPATGNVSVPFALDKAEDVHITLTNIVGQVIATQNMGHTSGGTAVFNTASLSNGVYIYTLYAGGERSTGRVVVAH